MLIDFFSPKSVVDVGCGLGSFLKVFEDHNVSDVYGVEGNWLDLSKILINKNKILLADIEKGFHFDRQFDIALCLEVAEHLHADSAERLISCLTSLSDIVVFSAAIPYQGGQNHVNEQWIGYWQKLFLERGFRMYDLIRPLIWERSDVYWWYRQNIVVCIKDSVKHSFAATPVNNLIHPELYVAKIAELNAYKQWVDNLFAGNIDVEVAKVILAKAEEKGK